MKSRPRNIGAKYTADSKVSSEGVASRLIELSESDTQHILLETESWFALAVTQAIDLPDDAPEGANLREGYRTTWADAAKVTR